MEFLQQVIHRKILLGGCPPFIDSEGIALASAKNLQDLLACSCVRQQALFLVLRATYVVYQNYNVPCKLDGISDCPENVHCEKDGGTFVTRDVERGCKDLVIEKWRIDYKRQSYRGQQICDLLTAAE